MKDKVNKKTTKPSAKSVSYILDETGSMMGFKTQTISGFNEYIKTLKADKLVKYKMTLTRFNSNSISIDYLDKPIADVPELTSDTYRPRDLTPLYDAIGKTITDIESKKAVGKDILFVIMTDGQENASKEYTRTTIFDLIKKKTADGWTFVFLGATQDAYAEAGKMGVSNAVLYSLGATRQTFAQGASATMHWARTSDTSGFSKKK